MNGISPVTLSSLIPAAPEIFLVLVGVMLIIVDLFVRGKQVMPWLAGLGIVMTMILLLNNPGGPAFSEMFTADSYSLFFKLVCLTGALLTVVLSPRYLELEDIQPGEYYALLIFSIVGMMCMASATDLITLYTGLELMALSVYCLAGLMKADIRSNEAAIKYYLMGAFSSAILLYGISLLYGLTGTTSIVSLTHHLPVQLAGNHALMLAIGLILVSLFFKVAAAPFHMWTPDVYEGAPTSITAFMSVAPKAAAFAVLGRILLMGFPGFHADWGPLIAAIALLTMAVGNIVAIAQQSIKRMLAYSSIAHAGYGLLGILAGTSEGLSATMNYMLVYAFMNMGAFAVVILLAAKGQRRENLEDYKGLAKTNPLLAATMLLFMFSLIGIPPTAGFIGKFYLMIAAIHAGYTWVVVGAVIFSAISAFFYLRVVHYMYMLEPATKFRAVLTPGMAAVLIMAVGGVVGIGILPESALEFAGRSLIGF